MTILDSEECLRVLITHASLDKKKWVVHIPFEGSSRWRNSLLAAQKEFLYRQRSIWMTSS